VSRTRNAFQRAKGKVRVVAGRLTGRRRTVIRGRVDQAKADLKDGVEDLKNLGRQVKGS